MSMMRRAQIAAILAVTLLGVVIAGDGPQVRAAGPVVLRMWHPDTREANVKARTLVMDDFRKEHPGVSFEVTTIDWNSLYPKLQAAVAAGASVSPDIYFLDQPSLVYGAAVGNLIQPITDVIKNVGADKWPSTMMTGITINGQVWGMPVNQIPNIVWYRKDLFAQSGLRPPTSLVNLLTAARKLNNPPRMYGIALYNDLDDPEVPEEICASFGCRLFNDKGEIVIKSPETIRALDFLKQLWRYASPDAITKGNDDARLVFDTGGAAMILTSTSEANDFARPQTKIKVDQVATAPIPNQAHKVPATPALFTAFVIPQGAKNPDMAKQFLEFWASDAEQLKFFETTVIGHIPVTRAVAAPNSPYWTSPRIAPLAGFLKSAIIGATKDGFVPGMYPRPNACGPKLIASGLFPQMVSRLEVDGWTAERVASWAEGQAKQLCG